MPNQSTFQRVIALLVIGVGLIVIGVAAMTLITLRQNQPPSSGSAVPIKVNYAAPVVSLNDVNGKPVSLTNYQGKVVLVNMWATWCPPCREEMPTLKDFYDDHAGDGFVIIGLNDGDPASDVRDFVTQYGLTFPVWLDPNYTSETIFGTTNLPSSFLVDRQGTIRLQWVGAISRAMLDKYVLPIINE